MRAGGFAALFIFSLLKPAFAEDHCDYRILAFRENNKREHGIVVPPFNDIPTTAIRLRPTLGITSDSELWSQENRDRLLKLACDITKKPSAFNKQRANFAREAIEAPIAQPRQIVAVGLNYADHSEEVGIDKVVVFPKNLTITGPYSEIRRPPGALLDWEVELAIVVRKKISRETQITPENAAEYFAGFVAANDVTDRVPIILDTEHGFSQGKTHPGFLPVGPYLAPIDNFIAEKRLNPELDMKLNVNGDIRQDSNSKRMANSIPKVLEKILREADSLWTDASRKQGKLLPHGELLPGDLIVTGTPGGTAIQAPGLGKKIGLGLKSLVRRQNPRWVFVNEQYCSGAYLRDSDRVSARIATLGAQENLVVEAEEALEPKVACSSRAEVRRRLGI